MIVAVSFCNKMEYRESIFGKNEKKVIDEEPNRVCLKIKELDIKIKEILNNDHYVARSEYSDIILEFRENVNYFEILMKSGMLEIFCAINGEDSEKIKETIENYEFLIGKVNDANYKYIEKMLINEKEYLDNILYEVDPKITLDEDQRKVILTDEDYCLVIAGAGAGKTTTVAAKVKYLVDKKKIDEKEILVISFTNKAVEELKKKINKDLKIECPIATFHSTGNAILNIYDTEKYNIVDNAKLYYILQDYFKNSILTNEELVNSLILFFASYFEAPYEGNNLNDFFNKRVKINYTTMRSDLDEFKREIIDIRSKKNVTIQNEVLRSYQEVEIANFLYLNNIDYEYEPLYPYNIDYALKPHTPDFIIRQEGKEAYIEHFGITEDGKNNRYTEDELMRYKNCIYDKIRLHRAHGTTLIYTFSRYKDNRGIIEHLQEKLKSLGFVLNPRSNKEIMKKLISSEESKYIRGIINLICRFIKNFKVNGYGEDEFSRMYHSTTNVRSKLFLKICEECFLEYKRFLKETNAVDFEDMINESARILHEVKEMKQKLKFKYIIVDEYQDISKQRFDLTKALSEVTDSKIIAVGDDWQSIYAFSGSDISLFTKFEEKMGYAKLLKIVHTYRNSQNVIDIAGNFIQKNPMQIEKKLISPKRIEDPVIIYTYDTAYKKYNRDRRSGVMYAISNAVEVALEQIMRYNHEDGQKEIGSILLLGRYGFDGYNLERSGLFEYKKRGSKIQSVKYPKLNITFMTVHMSKGLGYDNVIVINGKNETYGFPSKIEDDPVLLFVTKGDNSIDYSEERRLFYVAMTRTKNRVYFIAPEQNPSEFLLEIKHDYKNVVLKGKWNENKIDSKENIKKCPICGYTMQCRYKNSYGLKLYICTNEPEICGFMTNEIKAGKLSIMKCEKCRDGYLIAKHAAGKNYFLGCTNYKIDRTGCNNTITMDEYYMMMNLSTALQESREDLERERNNIYEESVEKESEQFITNREEENKKDITTLEETFFYEGKKKGQLEDIYYKGYELNGLVRDIFLCITHISINNFQSMDVLIATLRGEENNQIKKENFQNIPEYGIYSEVIYEDICTVMQWLMSNHYIFETKERYAKIHFTYESLHYLDCITTAQLKDLQQYLNNNNKKIMAERMMNNGKDDLFRI